MGKPKIRFKGYTGDWEQRKLGEVFKEYSKKNHIELPALTIIQGGGTVKREDSDRNLMYDESNLSNYKMVRKDDFIVHLRSFEGGFEKSSLDGIISPAYHTFHSDVADSRFYYPYFRSHEFIKHKLVPHVYGIRDGRSIDIGGMKTIEIPYTSLEEQRKIGDYLEKLDHLITLHQRKYFYATNITKCIKNDIIVYKYHNINNIIKRDEYKNKTNYSIWKGKDFMGERNSIEVYHGSGEIIYYPEIRKTKYTKDFSWGFYCTKSYEQAKRWAERKHENGIVNVYRYIEDNTLNIKKFDGMTDEWLDFIAGCRNGRVHDYDIVEGPMADDTIWNFVNDYLNGNISRTVFWEYARFKHPTHQISFHSIRALNCLEYERSEKIDEEL